ncbi:hypothetical protein HFN72_02875 [Rhizobium laguerreae]|uniref:hypothetical protein n=1 Tax=Rhizobium laguerreae TaxID=1076926 RepID=UPI001C92A932|nr:hypothetical protein [Rhizobium laguerreae]MBY3524928.1 hypothetical protein [Rhizobium laguerreae]
MPRNSSGVYSKPAGTTPSVGQVIDPVPWNALTTDLGNELTNSLPRDGSAPMAAPLKNSDGTQAQPSVTFSSDITTGMYRKASGIGALVAGGSEILNWSGSGVGVTGNFSTSGVLKGRIDYAEKSGNYLAVAADAGTTLRFTATATLSLTASATLASGWSVEVFAYGGDVTITPNGTETINGIAIPLMVNQGRKLTLYCDGVGFYTAVPGAWETIGDYSFSAVGQLAITGLSAFRKLRISGYVYFSATGNASIQTSSNNGSSYDSGATDYTFQSLGAIGASTTSSTAQTNGMVIANSCDSGLNSGINLDTLIENFNQAVFCRYINRSIFVTGGSFSISNIGGSRAQATARNAFRLFCSAGTMSGSVTVEGVRS